MYKASKAIILATVSAIWTILLTLVVFSTEELINAPTDYTYHELVSFSLVFIAWTVLTIFTFKIIKD